MLELINADLEDYELWGKLYREFVARNAPIEKRRKCSCGCGELCLEGEYYIKGHSPNIPPGALNAPRPSMRGENHTNWKGGVSFKPYCEKFNYEFKESIRIKFRWSCFLCGKTESEQKIEQKKSGKKQTRLSIHHVNLDKNCLCDDIECEFVPLCANCHSEIHHDYGEQDWEKTFTEMLIKQKKNRI